MKKRRILILVSVACALAGAPWLLDFGDSSKVQAGPRQRMDQSYDCYVEYSGGYSHQSCYDLTGSDASCGDACQQKAATTGGTGACVEERGSGTCHY